MNKAWIIYEQAEAVRNRYYIELYKNSCARRGVDIRLLLTEQLDKAKLPDAPDFAVVRTRQPSLSRFIESLGVVVFNSSKVSEVCNDKRRLHQFALENGLPVMDTRWGNGLAESPSFPVVVKPAFGRGGQDVFLARNAGEYGRALKSVHGCFVVQDAADTLGRDLRVYLLGKEIVATVLRSSDSDFRANYGLGGRASLAEPGDEVVELVEKISGLMDFGLVGVDFLFHNGHPVLNEIEDVVGARMLYSLTDIDIADRYISYILKTLKLG